MIGVFRQNSPEEAKQAPHLLCPSLAPAIGAKQHHIALPLLVLLMLCMFLVKPVSALETIVLTGRIMDIDAKPVAGAELFVYNTAAIRRPADFISARTGEDGRFTLTLPRQKFWAVARVRSGDKFGPLLPGDRHSGEALLLDPEESGELQQDFTVVNIREAVRQKPKIRMDYQHVSGRILDEHGKPVLNAYAFAHTETVVQGVPEYVSPWSDENGVYILYLPPGRYYLGTSKVFPPPQETKTGMELVVGTGKNAVAIDIKLSL